MLSLTTTGFELSNDIRFHRFLMNMDFQVFVCGVWKVRGYVHAKEYICCSLVLQSACLKSWHLIAYVYPTPPLLLNGFASETFIPGR